MEENLFESKYTKRSSIPFRQSYDLGTYLPATEPNDSSPMFIMHVRSPIKLKKQAMFDKMNTPVL